MKKILFQGDSITDANRTQILGQFPFGPAASPPPPNEQARRMVEILQKTVLGTGYPTMVAGELGCSVPGEYEVYNRAVSGARIVDLYAQIKRDFINLQPDIISILVGINDVAHEAAQRNGVDAAKFERVYEMLLSELKEALPGVRFIIMEPYVLRGPISEKEWDFFVSETRLRAEASKRVAEKFGASFVPLQRELEEAAATAPEFWWSMDGVHPTAAGSGFIARRWLEVFHRDFTGGDK